MLHEETVEKEGKLPFEKAKEMFLDARRYVDTGYRDRWDTYFRIYRGERVDGNYFGTMEVINREPHTIIETLVANIAGGLPQFHFIKTNEEQNGDTAVLNGMLDYFLKYNDMNQKNQIWVRDMLMYGTGVVHVDWRNGKPWITNIPLRDFFFQPSATGMVKTAHPARWAGYEYLADIDEMKKVMIFDSEQGKMVKKYKNLDKCGDIPTDNPEGGSSDKRFKDLFNGSTLDNAHEKQMHVVRLYDLDSGMIVEMGNLKEFIYEKESYLQREEETRKEQVIGPDGQTIEVERKLDKIDPFIPIAILRDYIDASLMLGEGELSVIAGDSMLLNDYESMDADNNAYQNTPMYQIDPQYADLAAEIETVAGAVYPIPKGALSPIEIPQLSQDLEIKKIAIANRMRRATAADEAVQGVSQQKGRVTATEVQTQLNQAQNRFSTKITNLGSGGYAELGSIIFKMMQIFCTTEEAIRIVGKRGIEFKNFDPWEYNGEYEAQVELDSETKRKELEVGQKMNQIFEIISSSPVFDPIEAQRFIIQNIDPSFSDEKFNDMLPKQPPVEPDNTKETLSISYKDATPFTRAQIEKKLGLEPDPMHEVMIEKMLIETAADEANMLDQDVTRDGSPIQYPMEEKEEEKSEK